nr:MAG TPA: hypothetical protein [Caudoviricetes sp.]
MYSLRIPINTYIILFISKHNDKHYHLLFSNFLYYYLLYCYLLLYYRLGNENLFLLFPVFSL